MRKKWVERRRGKRKANSNLTQRRGGAEVRREDEAKQWRKEDKKDAEKANFFCKTASVTYGHLQDSPLLSPQHHRTFFSIYSPFRTVVHISSLAPSLSHCFCSQRISAPLHLCVKLLLLLVFLDIASFQYPLEHTWRTLRRSLVMV